MSIGTSTTHPLQIAEVDTHPGYGCIGVTFCPGKKQPAAMTGGWDRDLAVDLDLIKRWGAAAVVSLIEQHEIDTLGVQAIGSEVHQRQMDWLHLPIADVSVPGAEFETGWARLGEGLRARLRDGFGVVVHCKGGLGRAGTVAAKLLVELGHPPDVAIASVRRARPGAIETRGQVQYVRAQQAVPEYQPSTSAGAIRDRAIGALVGLAVGDAVGTTLEFRARDSYPFLDDMVGGGPFHLKAGEWTDDTSMALALGDTLLKDPDLDPLDLMQRFVSWREKGDYSCGCKDIGMTVSGALSRFQSIGEPFSGSTDPMSAGYGSLMRLAPVAVAHWADRRRLADVAARQSRTTHAAAEAVDACIAFADVLADAISGKPRSLVMASRASNYSGNVKTIVAGSWRGKRRDRIKSSGYVAHSLEAALWSVGRTGDFRSAVLLAANLGEDADTTAAIAGQLAGAIYGLSGIPREWLAKLAWRDRIVEIASALVSTSENNMAPASDDRLRVST